MIPIIITITIKEDSISISSADDTLTIWEWLGILETCKHNILNSDNFITKPNENPKTS